MSINMSGFLDDSDAIAISFEAHELPGVFGKELTIPAGTVALVSEGGDDRVLHVGDSIEGRFRALLVKTLQSRLTYVFEGLPSRDDLAVTVRCELELKPRGVELDLVQFRDNLMVERDTIALGDLSEFFRAPLRHALRFFCGDRTAEALLREDQRAAVSAYARQDLQKALLEAGYDLKDLRQPSFSSEAFEQQRVRQLESEEQARRLTRQKELEALGQSLDLEREQQQRAARGELERQRVSERAERFEELRERMGEDELKAMVMLLDDDDKRAALIKQLIDKDLGEDQRAAVNIAAMEQRLAARLEDAQRQIGALTGQMEEAQRGDERARRVACVVGKRLLLFDPSTNLRPDVAKEVIDTSRGSLGYLRSVRHERVAGRDCFLLGAQHGVYKALEGEPLEAFEFPGEAGGKGGANAVCRFDGRLFATHSEIGVVEWQETAADSGRLICEALTRDARSVRGACLDLRGRLFFSIGSELHAFDLLGRGRDAVFRGCDDSITAFLLRPGALIAGTKGGRLFEWSLSDPASARSYPVTKKNPIYMLKSVCIAGQDYLVVGSKDYTVTLAAPEKELYRDYRAREEVRWVDGAGDLVCGVSRSGTRLFLWDVQRPSEPRFTVRVADKIQDIIVLSSTEI